MLYQWSGEEAYKNKVHQLVGRILENQSSEGWFKEYEGADPGYMTQCLYYLVVLLNSGYGELKDPIDRSIHQYLKYFVHPDGSLGGHYGSRNTTLIYPGGLALIAKHFPLAEELLVKICGGILNNKTLVPNDLDFPNAIRLGANYLVAYQAMQEISDQPTVSNSEGLPCEGLNLWKWFPHAGCLVVGTTLYYAVMGMNKGGILKLYDKTLGICVLDERGYSGRIEKKIFSTQTFHPSTPKIEGQKVSLKVPFFKVNLEQMTPWKSLVLTVLGLTVFRFRGIRDRFKKLLVDRLIVRKEVGDVDLLREVTFKPDCILLNDQVFPLSSRVLEDLKTGHVFSANHMASADFYEPRGFSDEEENLASKVTKNGISIETECLFPRAKKPKRTIR